MTPIYCSRSGLADKMVAVLYHCPNTGFRVQGYTAGETSADHEPYERVTCLACKLVHLVNAKTGEVFSPLPPAECPSGLGQITRVKMLRSENTILIRFERDRDHAQEFLLC